MSLGKGGNIVVIIPPLTMVSFVLLVMAVFMYQIGYVIALVF
jgi:hypothetical protein